MSKYFLFLLLGSFLCCAYSESRFNQTSKSVLSTGTSVHGKCEYVNNILSIPVDSSLRLKKWAIICLARPGKVSDISRRNDLIKNAIKPYAHLHDITLIFFSEKTFPLSTLEVLPQHSP